MPRQALHGLLLRWWEAGWCPAGLVHALGHRPGRPDRDGDRGDLRRGTDPHDRAAVVRIMGHRLQAWAGRRDELPAGLRGLHGDYLAEQAARLERDVAAADALQDARREARRAEQQVPVAPSAARQAAGAEIRRTLAAARARRTSHPETVTTK